jgi:transcriptional regulator NrdR family protein
VTTTALPASKPLPNGKRDRLGILCPHCGGDTGVLDSRAADGNAIRRKRVCFTCGLRFRTFEMISDANPATWFRDKLRRQAAELRAAADRIERSLDDQEPA